MIVIFPLQYNYTYPSQMKNYLDTYFSEFKYKPCAIVGYSMGAFGGVRAIEALRQTVNVLGLTPGMHYNILYPYNSH